MTEAHVSLLNHVEDTDFEKRLALVEMLLNYGVHVNAKTKAQETPLHLAVRSSCLKVAQLLVEYGATVDEVDQDRRTPLHLCAEFSDWQMAKLLLKGCEIQPKAVGKKDEIPELVNIQEFQLMKLLVKCGKIQAGDMLYQLLFILETHLDNNEVQYYGQFRRRYTICTRTSDADDSCICLSFLESAYNALIPKSELTDWEKFWTYYQNSKTTQCENHSKHDKIMLNELRDAIDHYIGSWMSRTIKQVSEMKLFENSATPLHLAVGFCCRSPIFSDFQLQLADAMFLSNNDTTPITDLKHKAVQSCANENILIDFFILCLDHTSEYNKNSTRPYFGHNSYNERNQTKPYQMTEILKSFVNRKDNEGYDALLKAVKFNQPQVAQLLLRNGPNTCSITSQGYAALHIAVNSIRHVLESSNPVEMIQILLTTGDFSVNALTFKAETPLHLVISNCGCRLSGQHSERFKQIQDRVISLLLENKANVNQQDCEGMTPLMIASERGCYHIVKMLLDWNLVNVDLDTLDIYGVTALIKAARMHHTEIVEVLVNSGAPLIIASERGYDHIIKMLLNENAVKVDLDIKDKYGEIALIKAARMHHTDIVELLVNFGARVDLQDNRGFTALHVALHDPNEFTSLFEFLENESQDIGLINIEARRIKDSALFRITNSLKSERDDEKNIKNTLIKILLRNGLQFETLDFANNTPFDFLVDSEIQSSRSRREAQQRLDKMRNENNVFKEVPCQLESRWLHIKRRRESPLFWLAALCIMISEHKNIHPSELERFTNIRDNKGRTVLHYAAILSGFDKLVDRSSVFKVLLNSGCKIEAQDIYKRTPLHYVDVTHSNMLLGTVELIGMELSKQQQLIFRDIFKIEDVDDKTVEELWNLRNRNVERERIRAGNYRKAVRAVDLGTMLHYKGGMLIYEKNPYNFETGISCSIWTSGIADYAYRNSVTSCLTEEIHHLIERLANAIERKEPSFKCQPMLVGSAFEGTKIGSPDEFDFDLILTNFLVEVIPSPVAPEGFIHLKKKPNIRLGTEEEKFFDKDGTLLTSELNSRFQITLGKVLQDPSFWENESVFELTNAEDTMKRFVRWYDRHKNGRDQTDLTDRRINPSICTTFRLKHNRALEGEYLMNDISLDLVPCIHVDGWWPHKARSVTSDTLKANGCNLVFDQPQRKYPWVPFDENYARISFAPTESQIIRDSSPTAKAAYMVCKHLIKDKPKMTYVLKMCLLYCIEALDREDGRSLGEESNYSSVTAEKLSLWVEKMMRCYLMFFLQDFCPCYLMPSFCLPIGDFLKSNHMLLHVTDENDYKFLKKENLSFRCSVRDVYTANFDLFRKVCTRDTNFRLPKPQPLCERFDHNEFISHLKACFV